MNAWRSGHIDLRFSIYDFQLSQRLLRFAQDDKGKKQWAGADLNRRHTDFQSVALPTELPAHIVLALSVSSAEFSRKK